MPFSTYTNGILLMLRIMHRDVKMKQNSAHDLLTLVFIKGRWLLAGTLPNSLTFLHAHSLDFEGCRRVRLPGSPNLGKIRRPAIWDRVLYLKM